MLLPDLTPMMADEQLKMPWQARVDVQLEYGYRPPEGNVGKQRQPK